MARVRIAVTKNEFQKAPHVFEHTAWAECIPAPEDEAGLCAVIRSSSVRHVVVGVTPYIGELYETLPHGGVIARFGVGHDSIDKSRAAAAGLYCANTPGVLADSVAEFTIALMLAGARRLAEAVQGWTAAQPGPLVGMELRERRLTVIGCGAIGLRVARIAALAFGMRVTGFDVVDVPGERQREHGVSAFTRDFADAVKDADFISLHIAAIEQTRRFLNADRLAVCPPSAYLINTARGSVVDETALYDALRAGRLRGAALDVTQHEPYVPVDPARDLRALPNVLITPHAGSSTQAACDRMAQRALRNIELAEDRRWQEMDLLGPAARTTK
jgi:phosphoglycerate dehydrogenase-like enzyme